MKRDDEITVTLTREQWQVLAAAADSGLADLDREAHRPLNRALTRIERAASCPASIAPSATDRGFKHYPPIATSYGHVLTVYESSAAEEPCLWLAIDSAPSRLAVEAMHQTAHLRFGEVDTLIRTLTTARERHYQLTGRACPICGG